MFIGKTADITIFKKIYSFFIFLGIKIWADLGFLGIKKLLPDTKIMIPIKKQKDIDLTTEEKKYNQFISSNRVLIEHCFSNIKKYYILKNRHRTLLTNTIETNFLICASLANYAHFRA